MCNFKVTRKITSRWKIRTNKNKDAQEHKKYRLS